MKHFIYTHAAGQEPVPAHFQARILPELESLYAALLPIIANRNVFIYLGGTARGDGASSIGWALAYYLAMRENSECLFVDGDISSPAVKINGNLPAAGLSDYLMGAQEFRLLPFATELKYLAAVHNGRLKSSYVRLSEERASAFVAEATRYYRAVIFNSRPGFDRYSELWARLSDVVLLVASYRSTKREILDRLLKGFESANIAITGLIFNKQEYPIPGFLYRRL